MRSAPPLPSDHDVPRSLHDAPSSRSHALMRNARPSATFFVLPSPSIVILGLVLRVDRRDPGTTTAATLMFRSYHHGMKRSLVACSICAHAFAAPQPPAAE